MNGGKYRFTPRDNEEAHAEMTIAHFLDRGGKMESPHVQLIIAALGRKYGGDIEVSVEKNKDGTHNVAIQGRK